MRRREIRCQHCKMHISEGHAVLLNHRPIHPVCLDIIKAAEMEAAQLIRMYQVGARQQNADFRRTRL